jgi:hypothetical protein
MYSFPYLFFFLSIVTHHTHTLDVITAHCPLPSMFTAIRDSLKLSTPTRLTAVKIRSSAQSFFVPDRAVHFDMVNDEPHPHHAPYGIGMEDEPLTPGPAHLSRNKTERKRLQGLVRTTTSSGAGGDDGGDGKGSSKVRTIGERLQVWMVNDGMFPFSGSCRGHGRVLMKGMSKLFIGFWIALHIVAFSLSVVNYQMKDNLNNARSMFGWTFGKLAIPDS